MHRKTRPALSFCANAASSSSPSAATRLLRGVPSSSSHPLAKALPCCVTSSRIPGIALRALTTNMASQASSSSSAGTAGTTAAAASSPRGKFIVFEGIDGSGKGTQMKLCASFLFDLSKDYDVYMTREPTRDFKEIRRAMAEATNVRDSPEWYAEMFIKDRRHHVEHYIEPALARGTHVLCDRYKHSTLAYQHAQGLPLEQLQNMHAGLLVPDLTLIFDCDVKTAFARRHAEGATDVFEKDGDFQELLRNNYLKLHQVLTSSEQGSERVVIVRSDRPVQEIAAEVQQLVRSVL